MEQVLQRFSRHAGCQCESPMEPRPPLVLEGLAPRPLPARSVVEESRITFARGLDGVLRPIIPEGWVDCGRPTWDKHWHRAGECERGCAR